VLAGHLARAEATGERDVLIVGRGIEHREDFRLDGIDERIGVLDAYERVPAVMW
jgi:hypothetical protein